VASHTAQRSSSQQQLRHTAAGLSREDESSEDPASAQRTAEACDRGGWLAGWAPTIRQVSALVNAGQRACSLFILFRWITNKKGKKILPVPRDRRPPNEREIAQSTTGTPVSGNYRPHPAGPRSPPATVARPTIGT